MFTTQPAIDYDGLVKEDRVHGDAYLRSEIFDAELRIIFHQGWVYVAHASEVPEPGDYRLAKIGRQSVIVTRDDKGEIHLLMNRCTHRANAVCISDSGNANVFRCSYHGWTFRNNGDLVGVTYPSRYGSDFRKEDYGLRHVPRMGMYRGFIFGSLCPEGVSLDEHLGEPVKEQIDLFVELSPEGEINVRSGVHKYGYNANWKFQYENGMDGYHPNFVHKSYFDAARKDAGLKLDNIYSDQSSSLVRDLGNGHSMLDRRPYAKQVLSEQHGNRTSRAVPTTPQSQEYREMLEQAYGKERADELIIAGGTHMAVFPNMMLIGSHIRVIEPTRTDRTELYNYPVLLNGLPAEMNAIRLRGHESFYGPGSSGAPDDVEMFELNQIGLHAQVDPWLLLSRGLNQEIRDDDGTLMGQITDELPQRAFWRQWKQVLSQG